MTLVKIDDIAMAATMICLGFKYSHKEPTPQEERYQFFFEDCEEIHTFLVAYSLKSGETKVHGQDFLRIVHELKKRNN